MKFPAINSKKELIELELNAPVQFCKHHFYKDGDLQVTTEDYNRQYICYKLDETKYCLVNVYIHSNFQNIDPMELIKTYEPYIFTYGERKEYKSVI